MTDLVYLLQDANFDLPKVLDARTRLAGLTGS
jgi:hypothetical protein